MEQKRKLYEEIADRNKKLRDLILMDEERNKEQGVLDISRSIPISVVPNFGLVEQTEGSDIVGVDGIQAKIKKLRTSCFFVMKFLLR
jgi:hypothetical protein